MSTFELDPQAYEMMSLLDDKLGVRLSIIDIQDNGDRLVLSFGNQWFHIEIYKSLNSWKVASTSSWTKSFLEVEYPNKEN